MNKKGFIPGVFISYLTFPGIIVHEYAHKLFIDLAGLKTHEVKYFKPSGGGHVIHEAPKRFRDAILISMGPMIIGYTLCFLLGAMLFLFFDTSSAGLLEMFILWLGISIGMHSLPSNQDVKNLVHMEKRYEKKRGMDFLLLLVYPLYIFTIIVNLLRILWIDLILAVFVFLLPAILSEVLSL